MEQRMDFVSADKGLWISGVSEEVGKAIQAAVLAFRRDHHIRESTWRVRVFGWANGNLMDVWIGKERHPGSRYYRYPYVLFHCVAAAAQIRSLLEKLANFPEPEATTAHVITYERYMLSTWVQGSDRAENRYKDSRNIFYCIGRIPELT